MMPPVSTYNIDYSARTDLKARGYSDSQILRFIQQGLRFP